MIALTLFAMPLAQAYEGFGICNFGKEEVPVVICYGPAVLKDTVVTGDVKVAGPFTANNVILGSMTITGTADMQDATVKGAADVTGQLTATNATFKKGLTVTADNVLLHHTVVKGSMVITAQTTNPTLTMECGSSISGTMTFMGKAGIIKITDDSIISGKIVNGSMIFTKKPC